MPTQYRYALDQAADEAMSAMPGRDLRVLRDFFRFLAEHPTCAGEQQVLDGDGRRCEVKSLDRFVITYRADHAIREVRIAAVELC